MLKLIILFLKFVKPRRVKFEKWARLETVSKELSKVVESGFTGFPQLVFQYTSTTLLIPIWFLRKLPWRVSMALFYFAKETNSLTKIPMLVGNTQDKPVAWDYPGRDWNYYSHLLAKEYGWELQYIAGLDVDVALAHLQEILVDDQMNREFLWGMSEIAYPYNPSTKQSKFSPLPRPYFMLEPVKPIKRFRVPVSDMPMGIINDRSGMQAYLDENKEPNNHPGTNNGIAETD